MSMHTALIADTPHQYCSRKTSSAVLAGRILQRSARFGHHLRVVSTHLVCWNLKEKALLSDRNKASRHIDCVPRLNQCQSVSEHYVGDFRDSERKMCKNWTDIRIYYVMASWVFSYEYICPAFRL